MGMSPTLMRPRQTLHPEALAWQTAVVANGGSVTGTTLSAVDKFCKAIDLAGIRDRFYRLNLFCGSGLNACLVPLYRGPSKSGTQYGNATDTNVGPFVSGDYAETGASGGLKGNGTSKYLNTGLPGNTFSATNRHCSAYWNANATLSGNRAFIGNSDNASNTTWFDIHSVYPTAGSQTQLTTNYNLTHTAANRWQLAQYVGTDSAESYSDGADQKTRTSFSLGSPTASTANWYVFGINPSLFGGVLTDARICCYSIGLSMSSSNVADFYSAVQKFQTALTRNAA